MEGSEEQPQQTPIIKEGEAISAYISLAKADPSFIEQPFSVIIMRNTPNVEEIVQEFQRREITTIAFRQQRREDEVGIVLLGKGLEDREEIQRTLVQYEMPKETTLGIVASNSPQVQVIRREAEAPRESTRGTRLNPRGPQWRARETIRYVIRAAREEEESERQKQNG